VIVIVNIWTCYLSSKYWINVVVLEKQIAHSRLTGEVLLATFA
jgi:hypothetical protein